VKRIGASIGLGAVLLLGSAVPVAADTWPSPPSDVLVADASWTEVVGGVEYSWFVSASLDRLTGDTAVSVNYFAETDVPCPGGTSGTAFVNFAGGVSGSVEISLDLDQASASGMIRGTEAMFISCGESFKEKSRPRKFDVEFAVEADGDPNQFSEQFCGDVGDPNGPVLSTGTHTGRPAEGWVRVKHDVISVAGGIGRLEVVAAPGTPCELPEE
jgi:hypothetical protein